MGHSKDNDDTASVTSSTRSGTSFATQKSTQSAPSQLPSHHSAQSRLNDFYEHYERNARQDAISNAGQDAVSNAGSEQTRRLPPRPRVSGRTTALPKRRPKAKSAPSFEEERRARILHMKRLYGLGDPEVELQVNSVSNASATMSRVESSATLR